MSDNERRHGSKRKRGEKKKRKKSKHRKKSKKEVISSPRMMLSSSSASPSTSESELMKEYGDKDLPVEQKLRDFQPLSQYIRDRQQLLDQAFQHLSDDIGILIPDILQEHSVEEIKSLCFTNSLELSTAELRNILGLKNPDIDEESLDEVNTTNAVSDNSKNARERFERNSESNVNDQERETPVSTTDQQMQVLESNLNTSCPEHEQSQVLEKNLNTASANDEQSNVLESNLNTASPNDEPSQVLKSNLNSVIPNDEQSQVLKSNASASISRPDQPTPNDAQDPANSNATTDDEALERRLREKLLRSLLETKKKQAIPRQRSTEV